LIIQRTCPNSAQIGRQRGVYKIFVRGNKLFEWWQTHIMTSILARSEILSRLVYRQRQHNMSSNNSCRESWAQVRSTRKSRFFITTRCTECKFAQGLYALARAPVSYVASLLCFAESSISRKRMGGCMNSGDCRLSEAYCSRAHGCNTR
jgi:hypothetical protein